MAPSKNKTVQTRPPKSSRWKMLLSKEYLQKLVFDPLYITPTCIILVLVEIILNIFIIENVKYTEIDWIAYMQEVEGFLNGTLDYKELKGDTGPLVYPAGFVYIYSIFYYVTSQGQNVHLAQYIFLVIYILQAILTFRIIKKTAKIPPFALVIATLTSYRIHSIFVLRLFNDPIAVLLFYVSLNLFISEKWIFGSIFYSLAVSVKMNILLYAPALLIAYLTNLSYFETSVHLFICAFIQLILGLPFLYGNYWSYIKGSFDLGRIFEHKWTVNYRFLSRDLFENRIFHLSLLGLHILVLILFVPLLKKYLSSYCKLKFVTVEFKKQYLNEQKRRKDEEKKEIAKMSKKQKTFLNSFEKQLKQSGRKNNSDDSNREYERMKKNMSKVAALFVLPFFVTNLIGMVFARSLHYQFYSWYFHSLLYLGFSTGYSKPVIFLLLGLIEYCWNVYPSTNISSILLHVCHFTLLVGVYRTMRQ